MPEHDAEGDQDCEEALKPKKAFAMNSYDFTGKVALITGGGSGIGRATALAFGQAGARVVIAGRNIQACKQTVELIERETAGSAHAISGDITQEEDVENIYSYIDETMPSLDIAFLNAGVGLEGNIVDQPLSEFEQVMRTNCTGTWLCLKHALRRMIPARAGAIVTNLSVHAFSNVFAGIAAYAASKHAALALTKAAALEGAPHGVRVNGVAPGPIMTEMLVESTRQHGGVLRWAERIPQKRVGSPSELAEVVLWLASDGATFVNGATLTVDGGFLAY